MATIHVLLTKFSWSNYNLNSRLQASCDCVVVKAADHQTKAMQDFEMLLHFKQSRPTAGPQVLVNP